MSEILVDKQQLTNQLRSLFGGVMFHRGKEYFEQNLIGHIAISQTNAPEKIRIEAEVRGTKPYQTSIKCDLQTGQFNQSRCSCPYDWTTCKHAAALGLAFIHNMETLLDPESIIHTRPSKKSSTNGHLRINREVLTLPKIVASHQALSYANITQQTSNAYYLIIGTRYSFSIEIHNDASGVWNHWPLSPETLLQSAGEHLTQTHKELFAFLSTAQFKDGTADMKTLFTLLKASDIPLYLNSKSKKTLLRLNNTPQKIPATLFIQKSIDKRITEHDPRTDFVLRLKEPLYIESSVYSFFGNNCFLLIREKERTLELHPISSRLSSILSNITQTARENAYYYEYLRDTTDTSYPWETTLDEADIIAINQVIEEASDAFNLETTLTPTFKTHEYESTRELISVNYDSAYHTLDIRALIDYGFTKIDVSNTIYKSMRGGTIGFERNHINSRKNFHIAITHNTVSYAVIDHEKETRLFRTLHTDTRFGFTKKVICTRKNAKNIALYHKNNWPYIQKLGYPLEHVRDTFDFSEEHFQAKVNVDMNADNDWLTFDVNCYCGTDRVTLEDLKRYIHDKEDFIRMNDGRLMRIANIKDLERFVLMLESFHQKESGRFEGRSYHAPELENIFTHSPYYTAKFEKSFQKFMTEAQSGKPIENILLPKAVEDTLRDYQKDGVRWMHFLRKYRFAGILADDMGLGKTLQALTLLDMNKQNTFPSLVVCPKTLLFNWEQETEKFFPSMKTLIIEGTPAERAEKINRIDQYDLIIASYPSLKRDFPLYEKLGKRFHYCFIDEAQFMKNHKTKNAQIVKKIPADYRLALTGTPLENNVSEIWSIFDFLMPGFLGNYASFVKKFQTPIMKNNDARVLEELRKKISCFMLRRTKENVLAELPAKIEQTLSCELEEAQNVLYQEILANVKSTIFQTIKKNGFAKSHIHILAGLTKLRQVCNHPALLLKDKDFGAYGSAKLKIFEELIDEIISSDRKVLVFSQFTQMLDILQQVLKKKDIEHLYLSGKTKNRKELVQSFNEDPTKKVFLISLKAGGTGLNLTAADNVIIFDPWWNPSVENQAIDRAHRMGQTKSVNVYRLMTKGTIEEKILKLQAKKQFLFDNLVNENKDFFTNLTWNDIRELFD